MSGYPINKKALMIEKGWFIFRYQFTIRARFLVTINLPLQNKRACKHHKHPLWRWPLFLSFNRISSSSSSSSSANPISSNFIQFHHWELSNLIWLYIALLFNLLIINMLVMSNSKVAIIINVLFKKNYIGMHRCAQLSNIMLK